MTRIVVTGGGMGMNVVLSSLRSFSYDLSALIPMIAGGGSSGRLRYDLDIFPVGTMRQALVALSDGDDMLKSILKYRFLEGELAGHNCGNIFLAALQKLTGNITETIKLASEKLKVTGNVIPLTDRAIDICLMLENGDLICGEQHIESITSNSDIHVTSLFLEPSATLFDRALEAIRDADYIILGPGDFYFLLSSFLVGGFIESIQKSHAKKIFVCNISNRPGIASDFTLKDYVNRIESYIGPSVLDYIIYNRQHFSSELNERFLKKGENYVSYSKEDFIDTPYKVLECDLLSDCIYPHEMGDVVDRSCVRHDSKKLGDLLNSIISNKVEFLS